MATIPRGLGTAQHGMAAPQNEARSHVQPAAHSTRDVTRQGVDAVERCMQATEECIAEHPASSIAASLAGGIAIGFFAGLLFERNRRSAYDPRRCF